LFVIPFAKVGATHELIQGLFALLARAVKFAAVAPAVAPLNPLGAVTAIPFVFPLLLAYDLRGLARVICGGVLGVFAGVIFWLSEALPRLWNRGEFTGHSSAITGNRGRGNDLTAWKAGRT